MSDAQTHITAFWSTVAPDYEAHTGSATDLSPAMLAELRAHALERGLDLEVRLGDAVTPDFQPDHFTMLRSVGFVEAAATARPELALEDGVPNFFTARRP
jgi:hypothetical protein